MRDRETSQLRLQLNRQRQLGRNRQTGNDGVLVNLIRLHKFPKVNSKKMFEDLDIDKNGTIDLHEWMSYWKSVKGNGYSEEEIKEVLGELADGKGWVVFQNLNKK